MTKVSKNKLDELYEEIEWAEIFFFVVIFAFAGAISELGFIGVTDDTFKH
jgi:di/tricarboxylate transporter